MHSKQEQNISAKSSNEQATSSKSAEAINAETVPKQSQRLDRPSANENTTPKNPRPKSTMKVGGGIFRTSGNHTIIRSPSPEIEQIKVIGNDTSNVTYSTGTPSGQDLSSKSIISLFSFSRAWEMLSSPVDRWKLFSVGRSQIPSAFVLMHFLFCRYL